ncbi:hypothetical protein, partial [Gemmatimonas sp.]|uniref:hypothetical protein n=1 Tax=Gemmatimonas sp. TaxID=1962908 RepID=UPI0035666D84
MLAFRHSTPPPRSATTAIWPSGETNEISQAELNRLSPVNGIAKVRSLGAALLLAAQVARTRGLLAGDQVDKAIVDNVLKNDVSLCRRAALELGANGAVAKIDVLPLTATDRAWLKAVSLMRLHDFDGAVDQLLVLPVDGYPAATSLLAACRGRADNSHRESANESIRLRLVADDRGLAEGAAIAAGLDGSSARWIDTAGFVPTDPISDHIATPATSLLRFVLQPVSHDAPLSAPAAAPLAMIDEAIDKGARFERDSFNARPAELQYLSARTEPDRLSDEAVAELGFDSELVRRRLAGVSNGNGNGASEGMIQNEYLAGLLDLERLGSVSPAVAARHPQMASELGAFLADPNPQTLTNKLASDESLWPILSGALGPEAVGWNPQRG